MPTLTTWFRLILDARSMRKLSVAEPRYQAVMAIIGDGLSVSRVAEKVARQRADVAMPQASPFPVERARRHAGELGFPATRLQIWKVRQVHALSAV